MYDHPSSGPFPYITRARDLLAEETYTGAVGCMLAVLVCTLLDKIPQCLGHSLHVPNSLFAMGQQWSQFFPPSPTFTEADVPPQDGKIFLVTGGPSGIGLELVKILYSKNARVYIAGRSEETAQQAIREIRVALPTSKGSLEFLQVELDDLSSIKSSVQAFKSKESKLHVLWPVEPRHQICCFSRPCIVERSNY